MRWEGTLRHLALNRWAIPVLFCTTVLGAFQASADRPAKNVLIISEVGTSNPAPATIVRELVSVLSSKPEFQVNFYVESLDTPAFQDEATELKAEQQLYAKYQSRNIDVIVALGPTPLVFMAHFADTFLPGVPVVFCASSQEQTGYVKLGPRFTGSWLQLDAEKTVDAALSLLPGTRKVIVVGGSSVFDKTNETVIKASLRPYPRNVEFEFWTDLTMRVLLDRLRNLPSDSVVLYISFFADAAGNRFINTVTSLPLVTQASTVPVFGMSDTYLGRGIVGGFVLDYVEQGRIAAGDTLEILHGKAANAIPVRFIPGVYMFDARQVRRWGLSERNLPIGSTVLYDDGSVWQHIKWTAMVCVLIVLPLGSLSAYLLYSRRELKRARSEQARLSGMLINAHEEERKRLASELHDDFSQRLALLSVGMETAAELLLTSPEKVKYQLDELISSAGELSTDLHTFSHRLHSSTLERLGIVDGIEALCKETSSQQCINVDFAHEGDIHSVPPAVALCFYRIVQEALRNVKKHSGASAAWVRLKMADGQLHLLISDEGAGFNLKDLSNKEGIGIFTMEERARYINARLQIYSEVQKGTRIDLWKNIDQNRPGAEGVSDTPEFASTITA